MWQGTGIAASLWLESKRTAQRALDAFFTNQVPSFVLDAGATIEYLLKFVVADRDPLLLYDESVRTQLTAREKLLLVRPSDVTTPLTSDDFGAALDALVERRTISVIDARNIVNGAAFLDGAVPVEAAERLRKARNRGIHIGEFNADANTLAADLLETVDSLSPALRNPHREFWGTWFDVATPSHLRFDRTSTAEMQIRCCRAKATWYANLPSTARRTRLGLAAEEIAPCPVCSNAATISRIAGNEAPPHCIEDHERDIQISVLDCLHCGLTLFGMQIESAKASSKHE